MDKGKLRKHVESLCMRNLKYSKIKCCANCPFEDEICREYPELREKFEAKRRLAYGTGV